MGETSPSRPARSASLKGAVVSADSTGAGNAGSLTLTARDTVLLRGHSAVTTAASQATGGNIQVTVSSSVHLQDSQITAPLSGGAGDAVPSHYHYTL
jgi:hypothetical protein